MGESTTRRGIMRAGGAAAAGLAAGAAGVPGYPPPSPIDAGGVQEGRVAFPPWRGEADPPGEPPPAPLPPEERVGFAIIGLGRIALEQALPAFAECRMARPVALVSGSPEKAGLVARQYGIRPEAVLGYAQFERLRDMPEVQAVYIALPNAMHREFTERAAVIGKHVLTEKPMATSSEDCAAMIAACARAKVRLMVAYRCQYEQVNRAAIQAAQSGALGRLRFFHATNLQSNGPGPQWRYSRRLAGGGALPDIGLYCLNAARYLSNEEPVEVIAQSFTPAGDERYREVEESMSFTLRFPSGLLAQAQSSYGAYQEKSYRLSGERGSLLLQDAFSYQGQQLHLFRREGARGIEQHPQIHPRNQFALEIDHMARCVRESRRPHTPGEEGLRDQQIMEAIYRSAESGRPEPIPAWPAELPVRGPAPDPA
ncbi:Gfo/Idh/MocA family protein [Paracraurococcus lichenis]|uniref:Gfo/Idh/MocA family oxidoreductase n=1 Tax=Paracraurococcus lichenis TaxID=3064888 RepID=A0ABT9DS79_9PROT|nr:Gfo/Idh/MocA family oxidoreductase [Paracraurococcus sp. LOR1-02]MDO9706756.1 Gfo/Idh/MocA family oxidoreductase [Paracraurococcus sp. LOR1-02]